MKKMMIGIMTLAVGASLFAAGPNFVDKNGDKVCDNYVSRGNKTAYEAGAEGAGQYRNTQTRMAQGQKTGHHRFREEAPGQGRNRK
ncbi:hypothetical protein PM10SUCC1_02890 [Propionigenium maris DSM 9537]|uniref:Uncharacterized protein n=1 Tax=Propionigenium maris DSM 9537 TaxID=1123000 RepID=A0A9W6GGD8_9FUSO|nr:hypothetical protein [Propionigenium maris]GLI54774.1 hypothetical protein PM10SUCC1_02890 [Propionigenium maris DSM 9537]